jgi:hypothetical protein
MKRFFTVLATGSMVFLLSGCIFFGVKPGVCTAENTILKDAILGNWQFDFGFATRPVLITRASGSDTYHIVTTDPGTDPAINLNRDFKLCQLQKDFIFVEQTPLVDNPTFLPMRLVKSRQSEIAWMFETPDPNRADASGLTIVIEDPSGPGKTYNIQDTGATLEDFLLSAPYQFSGHLRRL